MPSVSTHNSLSETAQSILQALLYFDIFSYPLKCQEVLQVCHLPGLSLPEVYRELRKLCRENLLYEYQGFYMVRAKPAWVERRLAGNLLAEKRMKRARWVSRFIGNFPFVRAVGLSGSISKNYMAPDSDIDYFIITRPGRLWLARTLLVLFKKVFLFNSHRDFCVNYFVDTDHLEIEEQNRFTATEIVHLIPTYGAEVFARFLTVNAWTQAYFPNFPPRPLHLTPPHRRGPLKWLAENLFAGKAGRYFDTKCMQTTVRYWRNKFSYLSDADLDIALKSRTYVSKHHPNHFQSKVLQAHQEGIRHFETAHGLRVGTS